MRRRARGVGGRGRDLSETISFQLNLCFHSDQLLSTGVCSNLGENVAFFKLKFCLHLQVFKYFMLAEKGGNWSRVILHSV